MGDNLAILGGALAFIGGYIYHHSFFGAHIPAYGAQKNPIFINSGNLNCTVKGIYGRYLQFRFLKWPLNNAMFWSL